MLKGFQLLCFLGIIFSCGQKNDNKKQEEGLSTLGETSFRYLEEKERLNLTDKSLQGSGKIILEDPLAEASSLSAEFYLNDEASIEFVVYGDKNLENGVSLFFKRSQGSLKASLRSKDNKHDVSSYFSDINVQSKITIALEVHNDESPAHVIIFNGKSCCSSRALVDSQKNNLNLGTGKSKFSGVFLEGAKLSFVHIKKASAHHHHH